MEDQPQPSPKQLRSELGKFAKLGLGRSLPGDQDEKTVQALSDVCRELAADPSDDWKQRIARVVIEEVKRVTPEESDRFALAEVLAIGDPARDIEDILTDIKPGNTVKNIGDRHDRAAERYPRGNGHISGQTFSEDYRPKLLEDVGKRLLDRLAEKREEDARRATSAAQASPSESLKVSGTAPNADAPSTKPPVLLVGTIGAVLMLVGIAWLVAVAIGAIG